LKKKAQILILPEIDAAGLSLTPEFKIRKEVFHRLILTAVAFLKIVRIVIVEPFKIAQFNKEGAFTLSFNAWRKDSWSYFIKLFNCFMKAAPGRRQNFRRRIIVICSLNLRTISKWADL
jgi:hypothetical protein